jgi:hypothetical protein
MEEHIKRPQSVTIIATLIIVMGIISIKLAFLIPLIINLILMSKNKPMLGLISNDSFFFVIILGIFIMLIDVIAGIAMLRGKNWGRQVFIGVTLLQIMRSLVQGSYGLYTAFSYEYLFTNIFGLAISILFIYLLTRPNVDNFFGDKSFSFKLRPSKTEN